MPDRNPKINRLLIFITVFLCLICGLLFTQSSAGPFGNNYNSVVTGNTDDISIMASNSGHNSTSSSTEVSATPSITPSPAMFLRKPKTASGQRMDQTGNFL